MIVSKILTFLVCLTASLVALVARAAETSVDVLTPSVLNAIDQPGLFSFATILGAGSEPQLAALNATGNPKYRALVNQVTQDVEELKHLSGEKMAFSSVEAELLAPKGSVARHFDPYWLSSSMARFPLIAVVNRIDKKDFYPAISPNACGEVRLIYRLAYAHGESRSTLPFFLNAVFDYPREADGSCRSIAEAWVNHPQTKDDSQLAQWLLSGPLSKARLKFKQIELNFQVVRFPSTQKTDFGGQAIYLFRIFKPMGAGLQSIPLENTPNVGAISGSPELRAELVRQLTDKENLRKIDQGTFVLQNTGGKLLANRALSFSTSGRMRLANKPFSVLFGADGTELRQADFSELKFVRSASGLLERLNNNTCMGCHQSGGTAGFHMLGETGELNSDFNQVVLPFSTHYAAERVRRQAYVTRLARGENPSSFRPPSFFTAADWSTLNPTFSPARARELCMNPGSDFSIGLRCESGSVCKATVINSAVGVTVGECVANPDVISGHVCRSGAISNANLNFTLGDLYNLDSSHDAIDINTVFSPHRIGCGNPQGGVPLGRISRPCNSDTSEGRLEFVDKVANGAPPPAEFCAIRGGPQFDECAVAASPTECLAKAAVNRGMLDSCYAGHFCREDYICQRLPKEIARLYSGSEHDLVATRIQKLADLSIGFCVPNYFIFNMRTDGHVIPEGRSAH